ncbi:hypothetical protein QMO56_21550 [Roseomonas sp. E05]|uniref:hypothetical protein n=1 Tax=Roseomonas sp. E05 TaxID=3046310 RepID=UPI0024B9C3CE|nr:hypothetical protein [Roseomonas sp. E05]MDJ0390705.1 hypothetical protein [Roseomonas sp. E05]
MSRELAQKITLAICMGIGLHASHAIAQIPSINGPNSGGQPSRPATPPRPATTWDFVEQPVSALLNGGYRVAAMSGPALTLEKDGKYLLCEIRPAGFGGTAQATSECHRLN